MCNDGQKQPFLSGFGRYAAQWLSWSHAYSLRSQRLLRGLQYSFAGFFAICADKRSMIRRNRFLTDGGERAALQAVACDATKG